jgi:hypothetical protein
MSPKLLAVVKESVGESGGEGRKLEPVVNDVGRGKEGGAVFLVSLWVEGKIRVDDPRDVVYTPRVVKRV